MSLAIRTAVVFATFFALAIALGTPDASSAKAADDSVAVATAPHETTIRGQNYVATIATDGCLEALELEGVDLLDAVVHFSRGSYFYPDIGPPAQLPNMEVDGDLVTVESDDFKAEFEFGATTITALLHNRTDATTPYYLVLSDALRILEDSAGRQHPVSPQRDGHPQPTAASGHGKTVGLLYEGGPVMRLEGEFRWWGPWAGRQVVEVSLAPNSSERVVKRLTQSEEDLKLERPAPPPRPETKRVAATPPAEGADDQVPEETPPSPATPAEDEPPEARGCGACRAAGGSGAPLSSAGLLLAGLLPVFVLLLRRRAWLTRG